MAFFLGTNGNDFFGGTAEADKAEGRAGRDTLFGGSGDDTLAGGAGNDRLFGGAGYDQLSGGSGNDVLVGTNPKNPVDTGDEVDSLLGGSGADQFVLGGVARFYDGPGNRAAVIQDFKASEGDKIVLKGKASEYILDDATEIGSTGISISTREDQNLIAVVRNVSSLSSQDFVFFP